MSRDDGLLFSGMNSSSMLSPVAQTQAEKRKEDATDRAFERKMLEPYVAAITEAFQKEIDEMRQNDYRNLDETLPDAEFKSQVLLNKKTIEAVAHAEQRIINKLRASHGQA